MSAEEHRWNPDRDEDEDEGELQEQLLEIDAFERQYQQSKSWEQLQEDEHGRLVALDVVQQQRQKRRAHLQAAGDRSVRRGLIRYLVIVLDLSAQSNETDMRPTRLRLITSAAAQLIRDFFDYNPLSQICVVTMHDGKAHRLTEVGQPPEAQVKTLMRIERGFGSFSLQKALEEALSALRPTPPYGLREVLVLSGSLCTVDPGDVFQTVSACSKAKARVSVVGMGGELHVFRRAARDTGGTYGIALSENHFEELVEAHRAPPPASQADAPASLVEMGFAEKNSEAWAPGFVGPECAIMPGGFTCPRCRARVREIPSRCHVCSLLLISSPHLAKSYHHLFPVKTFEEISHEEALRAQPPPLKGPPREVAQAGPTGLEDWSEDEGMEAGEDQGERRVVCFGCMRHMGGGDGSGSGAPRRPGGGGGLCLRCPGCEEVFCFECDQFIHSALHNCPGCILGDGRAKEGEPR